MTERRLRRVIRSVIRETYESEEMYGFEDLQREYQNMVRLGASYQDLGEMLDAKGIKPDEVEKIESVSREAGEVVFHARGNRRCVLKKGPYSIELIVNP